MIIIDIGLLFGHPVSCILVRLVRTVSCLVLCSFDYGADTQKRSVQQDAEDHRLRAGTRDFTHTQDEPHCWNVGMDGAGSPH